MKSLQSCTRRLLSTHTESIMNGEWGGHLEKNSSYNKVSFLFLIEPSQYFNAVCSLWLKSSCS